MPVYLLTGASRGIGLELARQISAQPDTTLITLVRTISPELEDLGRQHPSFHILRCDITSPDSTASLSTHLPTILGSKKITHLLNNAGILTDLNSTPLSLSHSALSSNILANVLGPAAILSTVLPFIAPHALVVNTTSGIASLTLVSNGTIPPNITAYSISKCALNMLSVHQARHLKGRCRVVCLDLGHVKTRMGGEGASVEIGDSVRGILEVVGRLDLEKDGDGDGDVESGRARFWNYLGEEVPW